MTLEEAKDINLKVRNFFEIGHKSSNKSYDTTIPYIDLEKSRKRNEEVEKSAHYRMEKTGGFYEFAEDLAKMEVLHRSGNCLEMASLSAYYILRNKFVSRDFIYIGTVHTPADHSFCFVSEVNIIKEMLFLSVLDFTRTESALSSIIVDPWLNVACRAYNYCDEIPKKLGKWAREGKRIGWAPRPQYAGWYAPNGVYEEALIMHGPVVLTPF